MSTRAQDTTQRGRSAVYGALTAQGWRVRVTNVDGRYALLAERNGIRRVIRVASRGSGTWQTSTQYGVRVAPPESHGRFWVFVDLSGDETVFYVVPEARITEDIHLRHQEYLARHHGRRKVTQSSTHHAIAEDRIREWRDRWDLLDSRVS